MSKKLDSLYARRDKEQQKSLPFSLLLLALLDGALVAEFLSLLREYLQQENPETFYFYRIAIFISTVVFVGLTVLICRGWLRSLDEIDQEIARHKKVQEKKTSLFQKFMSFFRPKGLTLRQKVGRTFGIVCLGFIPFLVKIVVLAAGWQGYVFQSSYKVFQLLIPVAWRYKTGNKGIRSFWPTDEKWPSFSVWAGGIAIAFILSGCGILALELLTPRMGMEPEVIRAGFDARFSVSPFAALGVVVFLSFANSALEELHFRAWMDTEISRVAGNFLGITISAAMFAGMHALIFIGLPGFDLPVIVAGMFGLFICGVSWSLLKRKPGGIHAAWLSHGLTDAMLLGYGLYWLGYF